MAATRTRQEPERRRPLGRTSNEPFPDSTVRSSFLQAPAADRAGPRRRSTRGHRGDRGARGTSHRLAAAVDPLRRGHPSGRRGQRGDRRRPGDRDRRAPQRRLSRAGGPGTGRDRPGGPDPARHHGPAPPRRPLRAGQVHSPGDHRGRARPATGPGVVRHPTDRRPGRCPVDRPRRPRTPPPSRPASWSPRWAATTTTGIGAAGTVQVRVGLPDSVAAEAVVDAAVRSEVTLALPSPGGRGDGGAG